MTARKRKKPGVKRGDEKRRATTPRWPEWLAEWNAALFANDEVRARLPAGLIASGWLGRPGATEVELRTAERRIGLRLPPSYRAFLATSDGWTCAGRWETSGGSLRPVATIEPFARVNASWIEALAGSLEGRDLGVKEHVAARASRDSSRFRRAYMRDCLQIGDVSASGVYLLNPAVRTAKGEWEAWFVANWLPGAERFRTFAELVRELIARAALRGRDDFDVDAYFESARAESCLSGVDLSGEDFAARAARGARDVLRRLHALPRDDPFWRNTNLRATIFKAAEYAQALVARDRGDAQACWALVAGGLWWGDNAFGSEGFKGLHGLGQLDAAWPVHAAMNLYLSSGFDPTEILVAFANELGIEPEVRAALVELKRTEPDAGDWVANVLTRLGRLQQ